MRSGARWGRGSRFPEGEGGASAGELVRAFPGGGGRARRVAPPRNGCSGRACAAARAGRLIRVSRRGRAARAGGTGTRFSRRGRAARAGGPAGYARGWRGVVARRVAAVPVCPPFRDRSRGGREVGAAPPVAGGCCEAGLHCCGRRGAAVPGGVCDRTAGAMARRVYARGRRGAAARRVMQGDGGARRFRGIMQEGAGDGGPAGGCHVGLPAIS